MHLSINLFWTWVYNVLITECFTNVCISVCVGVLNSKVGLNTLSVYPDILASCLDHSCFSVHVLQSEVTVGPFGFTNRDPSQKSYVASSPFLNQISADGETKIGSHFTLLGCSLHPNVLDRREGSDFWCNLHVNGDRLVVSCCHTAVKPLCVDWGVL